MTDFCLICCFPVPVLLNLSALFTLTLLARGAFPALLSLPQNHQTRHLRSVIESASLHLPPSYRQPRRRLLRCGSWLVSLPLVVVQKCVCASCCFSPLLPFLCLFLLVVVFFPLYLTSSSSFLSPSSTLLPEHFLHFDITRRVLRSPTTTQ